MNFTPFLAGFLLLGITDARADACPTTAGELTTDRPDVTNSSIVVPTGSFQSENGVNMTSGDGGRTLDGTNTRWRFGLAHCLEVFVDLPTYVGKVRGSAASGFTDVAPGLKWQVSPVPGKVDLSFVVGAGLPTGTAEIAGRGTQPYLQMPWSVELRDGWGISGMFTEFFRPSETDIKRVTEATFVLEKKLNERLSLFTEYVGDYPEHAGPVQLINSGGLYHLSPAEQIDFHVAFGLNHNSPTYIVGIGYSFRIDGLFGGARDLRRASLEYNLR
ncbi:transporter [Bradyrhizobium sp. SZCCHNS2096]|uniref:transporter n=1 Tax=Bradyrhizobium sp. SZCCHNS2096 TaxID=3057309 RepID=UPI0029164ADF|nr:transporter [Bradyrhizobium sp. SZCCHNS2096]